MHKYIKTKYMFTAQQQRVHQKPSDEENLEIWIDKTFYCESFKRTNPI